MAKQRIKFQLYDMNGGGAGGNAQIIRATGGFVYVTKASNPLKATLFTRAGASQANGLALTAGGAEFYIEDSVDTTVDLFILSPSGHFVARYGVSPGSLDIGVDLQQRRQELIVPFTSTDYPAAVETSSGFSLPRCIIESPNMGIFVHTVDATETIDVGLLSSESGGDADGIMVGMSVATANEVAATLAAGAITLGALVFVLTTGGTVPVPRGHFVRGATTARTVSLTTSAGSDTCKGYVYIPYSLTAEQPGAAP